MKSGKLGKDFKLVCGYKDGEIHIFVKKIEKKKELEK